MKMTSHNYPQHHPNIIHVNVIISVDFNLKSIYLNTQVKSILIEHRVNERKK